MSASLIKGISTFVTKTFPNWSTHPQYGLKVHDLIIETEPVTEAIRRLPDYQQQMRARRQKVAMDLSLKQEILPKSEWTKPEEEDLYLAPYLDEVRQENLDRTAFRL